MKDSTRRRLVTINRVYAFCRKHQTQVQGYVEAMRQMGDKLARAELLAAQQETGDHESDAAQSRRDELRRVIREDYLVHLVRIARVSLPNDPELRSRFRLPKLGRNQPEFVAAVRATLTEAASRRELFIVEGMPETFVEDLEALLAQYVEAINMKALGEAERIGAVAELDEVTNELMQLVRRLDGINRKRWEKNPELLAAWLSAKDVSWPHGKVVAEETAPGPGGGG